MHNNVTLTTADHRQIRVLIQSLDRMIADVGDRHQDGDYQGAALEAVQQLQSYLEDRRKELAMEVE